MKEARSSGKKVEKLFCCFVNILGFVITPGGEEPLDTFFQVRTELAIVFWNRGLLAKLFLLAVLKSKAAVSLVKSI